MRKITVKIKGGQCTVTPEGFKGETCKDASRLIEKALGKVVSDTATDEAYQVPEQEFTQEGN